MCKYAMECLVLLHLGNELKGLAWAALHSRQWLEKSIVAVMGPGQLQRLEQWRPIWLCRSRRACQSVPGNNWQMSKTVEGPKPAHISRLQ